MSDDVSVVIVYMTFGSREEAERIAGTLVREKLAACVNVLGGITSIYTWEGDLQHAEEVAVLAKTMSGVFPRLEARVKELHSYECPCIVSWPLGQGHGPFLEWIKGCV